MTGCERLAACIKLAISSKPPTSMQTIIVAVGAENLRRAELAVALGLADGLIAVLPDDQGELGVCVTRARADAGSERPRELGDLLSRAIDMLGLRSIDVEGSPS